MPYKIQPNKKMALSWDLSCGVEKQTFHNHSMSIPTVLRVAYEKSIVGHISSRTELLDQSRYCHATLVSLSPHISHECLTLLQSTPSSDYGKVIFILVPVKRTLETVVRIMQGSIMATKNSRQAVLWSLFFAFVSCKSEWNRKILLRELSRRQLHFKEPMRQTT